MALSAKELRAKGSRGVRIHPYPVEAWGGEIVLLRELHGLQLHEWDTRNQARREKETVVMDLGTGSEHMLMLSMVEIELDEDTLQREQAKLAPLENERRELLAALSLQTLTPSPQVTDLQAKLTDIERRMPPAIGLDIDGRPLGKVIEVFPRGNKEDCQIIRSWGSAAGEIFTACLVINRLHGDSLETVRKNLSRTLGRVSGAMSPTAAVEASKTS